ncbi:3717_t:CDS:2, partial [Racocetra persica]
MPPVSKYVRKLQKNISIACQILQNIENAESIEGDSDISDNEVLEENVFMDEEKAEACDDEDQNVDCIDTENNQQQSIENNQQQSIDNNQQQTIAPNALNANKMNLYPGGNQPLMCSTIWNGHEQKMGFSFDYKKEELQVKQK